jgi:hypothetical protein
MNVTMEVGLEGLIRSLGGYSKDPAFNKPLQKRTNVKQTAELILLPCLLKN